jgi:hypothetical protein
LDRHSSREFKQRNREENDMKPIIAILAFMLTALSVTPASAKTERAAAGLVSATLSYREEPRSGLVRFRDMRVVIARPEGTYVDELAQCPIDGAAGCAAEELRPSTMVSGPKAISARNVDSDAEREVLVELMNDEGRPFSLLYDFIPSQRTYARTKKEWGAHGYQLTDLDGDKVPEFRISDERITGDACDVPKPPQVFSYRGTQFVDVTREFPRLVALEARGLWKCIKNDTCVASPMVVSAAYLADMYLLGLERRGWRRVRALYRAGQFGSKRAGQRHLRKLRRLMKENGYMRTAQ